MTIEQIQAAGKHITTTERAQELGSLGGKARSDKKKFAAKIREIKIRIRAGQMPSTDVEFLMARASDSQTSALYVMSHLDEMIKSESAKFDSDLKLKILSSYMAAHKMIHGEKIKNENLNINMNINADIEAAYNQIKTNRKNVTPEKGVEE